MLLATYLERYTFLQKKFSNSISFHDPFRLVKVLRKATITDLVILVRRGLPVGGGRQDIDAGARRGRFPAQVSRREGAAVVGTAGEVRLAVAGVSRR